MYNKKPPFEITETIINDVIKIGELVGRLENLNNPGKNITLRKTNRIRTIYSSLAIEQNTLSLDQVTAVLSGKHILAPQKEIDEVTNAYEIYDRMDSLNPFSVDDFLNAHAVMTRGLVSESGSFRTKPVGVADSEGNIIHFGTLPQYVPELMSELFDWVKSSNLHMLIKSCVFHYEVELIHPFADGNGRMGRLWHTLLLSQWNPYFAYLPVESLIHDYQQEYYQAINDSNDAGQSEKFIEFMLQMIIKALEEINDEDTVNLSVKESKTDSRRARILKFMQNNPYIMNSDVQRLFGVSPATANRILVEMVKDNLLAAYREGSYIAYKLPDNVL